jgi:prephenate dehydrogenase
MKRMLPKDIEILGTHPLFGPDSASSTLKGKKIVVCGVRIEDKKYNKIKSYLEKLGLIVIETTPQKHDEESAKSLVLTHFIGRSLLRFGAKKMDVDTEGYNRLMSILETVSKDSWQLFVDMNRHNRFAKKMRTQFIQAMKQTDKDVSQ